MSARRVYETPDLVRSILEQCDRPTLRTVLTLERAFFPAAVGILYREVGYDVASDLRLRGEREAIYAAAIRYLDLTLAPLATEEEEQRAIIQGLFRDYPNLLQAVRMRERENDPASASASSLYWRARRVAADKLEVDLCVERLFSLGEEVELPHWPLSALAGVTATATATAAEEGSTPINMTLVMRPSIRLALQGAGDLDRTPLGPALLYLVTAEREAQNQRQRSGYRRVFIDPTDAQARWLQRVCAIDTGHLPMGFPDLEKILLAQGSVGSALSRSQERRGLEEGTGMVIGGEMPVQVAPELDDGQSGQSGDSAVIEEAQERITDVTLRMVHEDSIEAFEHFCDPARSNYASYDFLAPLPSIGAESYHTRLRRLIVDDPMDRTLNSNRHFVNLLNFHRAILAVSGLPKLETLQFALSIVLDGRLIPLTQVESPERYSPQIPRGREMGRLKLVTIVVRGQLGFSNTNNDRYPFPVEAVAESLAWLGAGPECSYELKNASDMFLGFDIARELHNAVHSIQGHTKSLRLPPQRRM